MLKRTFMPIAALIALTLAGCGGGSSQSATSTSTTPSPSKTLASETRIGKAALDCTVAQYIEDDGKSVTFDTKGKEEYGDDYADFEDIACVLAQLKTPSYVTSHMDDTTAMDGQQTDTWDGITARFKYHPDNGFDLTLIDERLVTR